MGYFSLFLHCDGLTLGLDSDLGQKEAQGRKSAGLRQPATSLGKVIRHTLCHMVHSRYPLIRALRVCTITDERSLLLSNDC